MSATQIKKVRAWHEELLEFTLANPRASLQEASLFFNVSVSWISIVKNSDAFQELWASRRGEHFSRVSATVSERVTALAEVTLDKLTNKIEKDPDPSYGSLKEAADLALRSLGFGVKGNNININNNNGPQQTNIAFIDKDTLAQARAAKAKLQEMTTLSLPKAEEKTEKEINFEREL